MKKLILTLILISTFVPYTHAKYSGGKGESNEPYLIATAEDMNAIGDDPNNWDKHFKLTADINMAGYSYTTAPIAPDTNDSSNGFQGTEFEGVFDGNGHTISSFTCSCTDKDNIGLFGYVNNPNAEIKNLILIDPNVTATGDSRYVGCLVGELDEGKIINCGVNGGSVSSNDNVGGLVGEIYRGTISYCYSNGDVEGNVHVGGLVGFNGFEGMISNSYSTVNVNGNSTIGGLVGGNSAGTISNCYSTGKVNGVGNVGGLLGHDYESYGTIRISYWDIETSEQTTSDGGIGKTTIQMQSMSTYLGWGCDSAWTIDDGNDYPHLAWEGMPGEPISPTLSDLLNGAGTEDEPYLIYTADELNVIGLFSCALNKNFKLMADIDLVDFSSTEFNIIGSRGKPFTGIFDGNNHTISNFRFFVTDTKYIGFFRCIYGPDAEIRDLTLTNPNINATGNSNYVGSIVGWNYGGTINNCSVDVGSVSGNESIGGLVGLNYEGTIFGCYSIGNVDGDEDVGGLVGSSSSGTISNCYSTSNVNGYDYIGGLVGHNSGGMTSNCYSTGNVDGVIRVGGLVGRIDHSIISLCYSSCDIDGNQSVGGLVGELSGTVSHSYSIGKVNGVEKVGGLVGRNNYSTVIVSFWDIETSEQLISNGGEGKTTEQMHTMNTYLGWGCDSAWTIDDGNDYPHLAWEGMPGEPISPTLSDLLNGDGTEDEPYLIYTADELNVIGLFSCALDKNYKLMADINLGHFSDTEFNIIGIRYLPFNGVFDGNGHIISNFTYQCENRFNIGLVGYIDDPNAEIRDLILIDPNIKATGYSRTVGGLTGCLENGVVNNCGVEDGSLSGNERIGGLAGNNSGTISGCYSTGSVDGDDFIGGLVGSNSTGTISNCYSTGNVDGYYYIGGLVGYNYEGTISNCCSNSDINGETNIAGLLGGDFGGTILNCYSTGNVNGNYNVGGLVGLNYYGGTISICYSTGSITGYENVGGLVGGNGVEWSSINNYILNCYSTGDVDGNERIGGLVGKNYENSTISNCYTTGAVDGNNYVGGFAGYNEGAFSFCFWDTDTSGMSNGVGYGNDDYLYGLSTSLMQMRAIYDIAGWDLVGETLNGSDDIWTIHDGVDYPLHIWEMVNLVGWYEVDFIDFSFFANHWQDINCADTNNCNGCDFDFSDDVDAFDLKIFTDHWLLDK